MQCDIVWHGAWLAKRTDGGPDMVDEGFIAAKEGGHRAQERAIHITMAFLDAHALRPSPRCCWQ